MGAMSRITGTVAVLTLVAAPLAAQGGPPPGQGPAMGRGMMQGGPGAMARNPVAVVLEHRDALGLSDDQVASLEALEARVAEENGPRWEQLKAAFGDGAPADMTAEERQALRDRMQELRPVREEVQATNRAAMEQVHELLTEEQEAGLRGIMRRGPDGRPGRGMRAGRPGQGITGPDRAGPGAMGAAYASGFRDGIARCRGLRGPAGPAGPGGPGEPGEPDG